MSPRPAQNCGSVFFDCFPLAKKPGDSLASAEARRLLNENLRNASEPAEIGRPVASDRYDFAVAAPSAAWGRHLRPVRRCISGVSAPTNLVQQMPILPTVERVSGHKTLAMVERYAHQSGTHIANALEKLDAPLSGRKEARMIDLRHQKEAALRGVAPRPNRA